jgi:hypothetical protein
MRGNDSLEYLLPCEQWQTSEVFPIQPEEVKRIEPSLMSSFHHGRKHGPAMFIGHGQLPVQHRHVGIHFFSKRLGQVSKAIQLVAFAREKPAMPCSRTAKARKPSCLIS